MSRGLALAGFIIDSGGWGRSALMDGTGPLGAGALICGSLEPQCQIHVAALLFELGRQTNHDLADSS